MAQPGFFISIEGGEGLGKSTALEFLTEKLTAAGVEFITTREPGGTEIAEAIRQVLLNPHHETLDAKTELLLMFAARAQNLRHIIQPALAAGKWVVSDRFVDASFAYQGGGRGIEVAAIDFLKAFVVADTLPDLTLLLDAPLSVGQQRMQARGKKDRIEQEELAFFERVRAHYLARAKQDPKRMHIIQAQHDLAQVQAQISTAIEPLLARVAS